MIGRATSVATRVVDASRRDPGRALLLGITAVMGGIAVALWIGSFLGDQVAASQESAGPAVDVALGDMIDTFTPVMVFSAEASPELFRPTSVEDFEVHSAVVGGNRSLVRRLPDAFSANSWRGERAYYCEWLDGSEPGPTRSIPNCGTSARRPPSPTIYARTVRSPVIGWYAIEYWSLYFDDYWSWQNPVDVPNPDYQTHEGDWEVITILFDQRRRPRAIIDSQHGAGEVRPWRSAQGTYGVQYVAKHPIVFVARGSHATYFSMGSHPIDPQLIVPKLSEHPFLSKIVGAAKIQDFSLADPALACSISRHGSSPASAPAGVIVPDYSPACTSLLTVRRVTDGSPRWIHFGGTWGTDHVIDIPVIGPARNRLSSRDGPPKGPAFQGLRWSDPWDAAADWCAVADHRRPTVVQADRVGYPLCHVTDTHLPSAIWVAPPAPSWWTIGYWTFAGMAFFAGAIALGAAAAEYRRRWTNASGGRA